MEGAVMTDRRRYHQLVFIWVRDPKLFAAYLRDLPPIVTRYGGAADLSLRPTAIWAGGLALPDIVNLVHYEDKEAYERFNADPEFQKIEPLRAGSVDLMTYEGYLRTADPSPAGQNGRVYHVEVAYRTDEECDESLPHDYGYRVEYVLDPRTAPPGRPHPNLIRISSAPDEAAGSAFDADATHIADHVIRLTARASAS
jgi:uncharacterized protein (DUF1330 family)